MSLSYNHSYEVLPKTSIPTLKGTPEMEYLLRTVCCKYQIVRCLEIQYFKSLNPRAYSDFYVLRILFKL